MTLTSTRRPRTAGRAEADRFRLHRAGILNVWQYDDQEFLLADGRMLLRGANGAGKSKTLEMLLPFAIDGDKTRITASARHHTSLLWLMTDGYEGQARVGYVWVEFLRTGDDGQPEAFTCGVGIRASASARTATAWFFTTPRRVGHDLRLEDDAGPMSRPRLEEALGTDGQVFQQATAYREHVGRALFGLDLAQYDDVLRLLYWLRQPQVGEDIEPARLAGQLAQALPQLDEHAVKAAGDTFDELTAFGEQIQRRSAAAEALTALASAYSRYARATASSRARGVLEALREERRLRSVHARLSRRLEELGAQRRASESERDRARRDVDVDRARISELEASPEARDQRRLSDLAGLLEEQTGSAKEAGDQLSRARTAHERRVSVHERSLNEVRARVRAHAGTLDELERRRRGAVGGEHEASLVMLLDVDRLEDPAHFESLGQALDASARDLSGAGTSVRKRQAAVTVVKQVLTRLDEARREQVTAERRAAETEARWEQARSRRESASSDADRLSDELRKAMSAWTAEDVAPGIVLPVELDPETLAALPEAARLATRPVLAEQRGVKERAVAVRQNADSALAELSAKRERVAAERDPAPPSPSLQRTPRLDGEALWRLLDFAEGFEDVQSRAALEAALQDSGLLDAWVRPDGALLDPESRDVLVVAGAPLTGPTAAAVLRAHVPEGSDVSTEVVEGVLRTIRLASPEDEEAGATVVGQDGSWRLGALQGRAAKERAQFIGATARAQERQRRLAEIDAETARQQSMRDEAANVIAGCEQVIAALEDWVRRLPTGNELRGAWTRLQERVETEVREEQSNAEAQAEAHRARTTTAGVRAEAEQLATGHELPLDHDALDALDARLRSLEHDLRSACDAVPSIRRDVAAVAEGRLELARGSEDLAAAGISHRRLEETAERSRSRLEELTASVGTDVRRLEERLAALRASLEAHERAGRAADVLLVELAEQVGSAGTAVKEADGAIITHSQQRARTLVDLGAMTRVPGLLHAALGDQSPGAGDDEALDESVLAGIADLPAGETVSARARAAVETLAALEKAQEKAQEKTEPSLVWRAYNEASSGPAADHEPVVKEYGDLLAVVGHDDAGERPVVELAERVSLAVARDRDLLTERERTQFEQHVLGELGDAIRRCQVEADELVTAMNQLLGGVTTSQGIRVRLDWRLRDDVPPEARQAVQLLGQPVGALLPEERAVLRDSLHRLIEVSRAERPDLAYGEHLATALDYRTWWAFKIRYTRPEGAGTWLELHRRSPLSQGEQKVLCYLPLFAAAAAHFSSLAGASAHAPRLVLLDDAFPKIDVRTHPLLFGLLVQLDLDFVITSERLWGDHDTVPSLAIYEALRDPAQRGIAQYEYRWDGRQLRSLG